MNVYWHNFWARSIKTEGTIRDSWRSRNNSHGVQEGIRYTGAEKGKRLDYPGRVGSCPNKEERAQNAIARKLGRNFITIPPHSNSADKPVKLPKIGSSLVMPTFAKKPGCYSEYRKKMNKTLKDDRVPKKPVFQHLHTVCGTVTKLIDS